MKSVFLSLFVLLLGLKIGLPVGANPIPPGDNDLSVGEAHTLAGPVLLLRLAAQTSARQRENRFVTQLRLVSDRLAIREVTDLPADFDQWSAQRQIRRLQPFFERFGATAALWLAPGERDRWVLHAVWIDENRALTRLVDVPSTEDAEMDLALAAREWLTTVGQSDVATATAKPSSPPPVAAQPRSPRRFFLLEGNGEGGIANYRGGAITAGFGLAAGYWLTQGLLGRLFLRAGFGPLDPSEHISENLSTLESGLAFLYLFRFGPLGFGPGIAISAAFSRRQFETAGEETQQFADWHLNGWLLGEVQWRLFQGPLLLVLGGGIRGTTQRESYDLASTDQEVVLTPFIGWGARIGLGLVF